MSPAQDQNQNNNQNNSQIQAQTQQSVIQKPTDSTTASSIPTTVSTTLGGKEREAVEIVTPEAAKEVSKEIEVPTEVERVGVKKIGGETVELPPDVKKLGVKPVGPSTPIIQTTALPAVSLPISDKKVIKGLHEPIINAFHWLAVWCIRKLKKAHVALKVIHGKIIRVKTD